MNNSAPILLLSQDYELFFHNSGSIEKCLVDPSEALVKTARELGAKVTFFVDAGMISCMDRFSGKYQAVARAESLVKRNLEYIAGQGHEIALHVHPHWEDVRWHDGEWDFSGTRYQPREFSDAEISEVFKGYTNILEELSGQKMTAYRAGGFCIEPFSVIKSALEQADIFVDSSVVPGAYLNDSSKGFDFRKVPDKEWWFFDNSVSEDVADGRFLEIPISAQELPLLYYWGRLANRLLGERFSEHYGDGSAKKIGRTEILRRLVGNSRIAEISLDEPKVEGLPGSLEKRPGSRLCHVMGHPKLLSDRSLGILKSFVQKDRISRFETVSSLAAQIREGGLN